MPALSECAALEGIVEWPLSALHVGGFAAAQNLRAYAANVRKVCIADFLDGEYRSQKSGTKPGQALNPAERFRALQPDGPHEWQNLYIFEPIVEVQQIVTVWLRSCDNQRPDMGIGRLTHHMKLNMAT